MNMYVRIDYSFLYTTMPGPDNTIKSLTSWFKEELKDLYEVQEVNAMLKVCAAEILGFSQADLVSKSVERVSESSLHKFSELMKGLKKEKPLQYVLGYTWFYGLKFIVNEDVLIPRPETEELVDLIIKENKSSGKINILDIGTGSGCIPVALKKNLPQAELSAVDISASALVVAKQNAMLNNATVDFFQLDILKDKADEKIDTYDLIVSNPPYVTFSESKSMQKNVVENEPHLALFVKDEDPLLFFKVISRIAYSKLKKGGKLYVEINEKFGKEVCEIIENVQFKNVRIVKDADAKDRIVSGDKM